MVKCRRVVVTGLGVVSSIGIGKEEFWKNLLAGKSGISKIERFDTSRYDVHVGGEIKNFRPEDFLEKSEIRRYGRATQFTIAAAQLAFKDANLDWETLSPTPSAVCLGTTMADIQALEFIDDAIVNYTHFWRGHGTRRRIMQYPGCMIASHVAQRFRLRGPSLMIPTACAAGNYAISYGTDLIRLGKCEVALVGGVDPFSRIAFTGFGRIFALAPDQCRPFDRNRKGTIVGEGAGILLLESVEHAQSRGANMYAEMRGYGTSCDAHHMTIPATSGIVEAIQSALHNANVEAREIDYISAHGTGTPANDRAECAAIAEVFGEYASRVPISSIKSMLGHTMGAASALEAIACVLAIKYNRIPPTINFTTPDPECQVDCVPNQSREKVVDIALNNSFAFGGNNACIVIEKFKNNQSN